MDRDDLVLVDTNVIIEAHRVDVLAELIATLNVATVEACVRETQTGAQNRMPHHHIDESLLRQSMTIFSPSADDIFQAAYAISGLADVDEGELHLLTQAWLLKNSVWFACSPDRHPMRIAIEYGWRERLVSLERLVLLANKNRRVSLRQQYQEDWHARVCLEFLMQIRR